jgi:hypothetical protein
MQNMINHLNVALFRRGLPEVGAKFEDGVYPHIYFFDDDGTRPVRIRVASGDFQVDELTWDAAGFVRSYLRYNGPSFAQAADIAIKHLGGIKP